VIEPTFLYLSVPEAAQAIGVTDGRVRQLLLAGELAGHKLGLRNWAIAASEIQRFLKHRRRPGRPTAISSG